MGNGETILLADDNAAVRAMLCTMLEGLGYKVIAACDGQEAVNLFESDGHSVDMLLFDIMMPNMTGCEAALQIRAQHPGLPLLLVSGFSDVPNRERLQQLDDYQLISKPLSIAHLGQAIRALLQR